MAHSLYGVEKIPGAKSCGLSAVSITAAYFGVSWQKASDGARLEPANKSVQNSIVIFIWLRLPGYGQYGYFRPVIALKSTV